MTDEVKCGVLRCFVDSAKAGQVRTNGQIKKAPAGNPSGAFVAEVDNV